MSGVVGKVGEVKGLVDHALSSKCSITMEKDTHNSVTCVRGGGGGEILAGIKFGCWASNCHCKSTDRFKFGGLVRDHYMYMCDYDSAVAKVDHQTAKFSGYTVINFSNPASQESLRIVAEMLVMNLPLSSPL